MSGVEHRLPEVHRGVDPEQPESHPEVREPLDSHEPRYPVVRLLTLKHKI